jgi:hypothetical protein
VNTLTVSFGTNVNLQGFPGNLKEINGIYYTAGISAGFETRFQSNKTTDTDTFVMRLQFFDSLNAYSNACLTTSLVPTSNIRSKSKVFSQVDSLPLYSVAYDETS